jgi:hypothetical protein
MAQTLDSHHIFYYIYFIITTTIATTSPTFQFARRLEINNNNSTTIKINFCFFGIVTSFKPNSSKKKLSSISGLE